MSTLPTPARTPDENSLAQTVSRLHAEIQNATSDLRRLQIRDQARAAAEAAKILGRSDIVLAASELVARAERALIQNNPPAPKGRGKKNVNPGLTFSRQVVSDMRVTHARLDDREFENVVAEHHELGVPITRKSLRDGPCAKGMSLRSGRDEWWTPPHIIEAARDALGSIDLDVASCAEADETVKATRFFDRETDGLQQPWSGRVWANPPFSAGIVGKFVSKLVSEADVSAWVCLLNSTTETAAGQLFLTHAHVVCFPSSRLRFRGPDAAGTQGTPLVGQMIGARFKVAPAEGIARFREAFSPLGVVLPGGASIGNDATSDEGTVTQ